MPQAAMAAAEVSTCLRFSSPALKSQGGTPLAGV